MGMNLHQFVVIADDDCVPHMRGDEP
ncbi:hypothetical protein MNBD_GAMMA17-1935 [hydrothermal vent metagenome]|uniref:Uncharacterized protein n=1 Tax=hydrothermal vent metagenome TaxID=652676 RepID=A0A3B0ZIH6_9ZZZZ